MDKKHFFLELSKVLAWPGVVVVVVAWFVFLAFLAGVNNWKPITDLINILIWPGVVAVILLAFYRPLAAFIGGLGGRVTKFSAFQISIELAALSEPPSPRSYPSITAKLEISGEEISSDSLWELFAKIEVTTPEEEYFIVDIKDGQFWLISRLFIFTVFLQAIRGVKCIVFVESKGDYCRQLIGLASPDTVSSALCEHNPWLRQALSSAMKSEEIPFLRRPLLNPSIAGQIIRTFIEDSKIRCVLFVQ